MQQQRPRILRTVAIAVALAAGGLIGVTASWYLMNTTGMAGGGEEVNAAHAGADFELPTLDGELRTMEDFAGQVVAVNFWASWCPPCIREMPMFEELQQEYQDHGFTFVGIAIDNPEDAAEFVEKTGVTYPVVHGLGEAMAAGDAMGNEQGTLPYTVLFDEDGNVINTWAYELKRSDLEPEIRAALGKEGTATEDPDDD